MPVRGGGVVDGPTRQVLRPARQVTIRARGWPTRVTLGCSWRDTAAVCVLSPRRNFAAATRIDRHKMKAKFLGCSSESGRHHPRSSSPVTEAASLESHQLPEVGAARVVVFRASNQLFAASFLLSWFVDWQSSIQCWLISGSD